MTNRTAGRALTVAALTAALAGAGAGSPAEAAPAVGPPPTVSTATTVLGAEGEIVAALTVSAEKRSAPTLAFDLYPPGSTCTVDVTGAELTLQSLATATVEGTFSYTCEPGGGGEGLVPGTVTGSAHVDLTWTGVGQTRRGVPDHCVGPYRLRPAEVTGSVVLTGGIEYTFEAPAVDDSHLSYTHVVCPPGIP